MSVLGDGAKGHVALYWYEWDLLGYLDSEYEHCGRADGVCGFDSNYPDYFPARLGVPEAIKSLQGNFGVKVVPYINGRIADVHSPSWVQEDSALDPSGHPHLESFGSGATFAVMCPGVEGWRGEVKTVAARVKRELGVEGIYVDQGTFKDILI